MFFGYHVLWPQGFSGAFDVPSAVIALAAAVALFKYQRNVIHVIGICGLLGVGIALLSSVP
jgi:chromate transporter